MGRHAKTKKNEVQRGRSGSRCLDRAALLFRHGSDLYSFIYAFLTASESGS